MDPTSEDSLENNRYGGLERDYEIDRDKLVERADLGSCSRETIENERGGWVVGGLGRTVPVEEWSVDERIRSSAIERSLHRRRFRRKSHDVRTTILRKPASSEEFVGNKSQNKVISNKTTRLHRILDLDACLIISIRLDAPIEGKSTEGCPLLDIPTQEITSTDLIELRKASEQSLALGPFTNARCTKEDDASGLVQVHSRRPVTIEAVAS